MKTTTTNATKPIEKCEKCGWSLLTELADNKQRCLHCGHEQVKKPC